MRSMQGGGIMGDIILLGIISWSSLYGVSAGNLKSLMRLSSVVGLLVGMWILLPGLKETLINPSIKSMYFEWLQRLIQPLVPVHNISTREMVEVTQQTKYLLLSKFVFVRVLYAGYIGSVFLGLWMILYSVETIWLGTIKQRSNKILGSIIGVGIGLYIDGMMLKTSLIASWLFNQKGIQEWIMQSVIAHGWIHIMSRGWFM